MPALSANAERVHERARKKRRQKKKTKKRKENKNAQNRALRQRGCATQETGGGDQ
jgi:hypothetical protein